MTRSPSGSPIGRPQLSARRLAGFGLLLELALLAFWAYSGVWRGSGRLILGFFLPGCVYLGIIFLLSRSGPARTAPGQASRSPGQIWQSPGQTWVLFAAAALFQLTFLLTPDPLSNDLYRYYWDGKLLSQGVNPYAASPLAPELAPYRDGYWGLIFNPDVPTGYPPLAEAAFALAYRLRPDPAALRVLAAAAALLAGALLMAALRAAGLDERRALLFAWSPLVALEFANSAHLDAMALAFLAAGLYFAVRRQEAGAAVCLALGGLVKFYPLLLLPILGRRWRPRTWLLALLVFGLPWLPLLPGGTPFTGLGIFAQRVDFNSSLYRLLEGAWLALLNSPAARPASLVTAALLLAGVYAWGARRVGPSSEPLDGWRFAGAFFGLGLLLSPVVHPWYACWMLAFSAFDDRPLWQAAPWLVLSVTVIFARHVYIGYEATGLWQEALWPALAVWTPFYLTALAVLARLGWPRLRAAYQLRLAADRKLPS